MSTTAVDAAGWAGDGPGGMPECPWPEKARRWIPACAGMTWKGQAGKIDKYLDPRPRGDDVGLGFTHIRGGRG